MQKNIVRRQLPEALPLGLQTLHPLLQRVYAARSVGTVDELDRNLEKLIPDAALLGMQAAVQCLTEALQQQKHIVIVGDFDADGATSTAVAIRALRAMGAKHVSYRVPNRFADGYGLTPELVASLVEQKPDLILTVDNGIANHAGVLAAKAMGAVVVVTDHHLPGDTVPAADAIVNPNQHGDAFPSKNLAGVGVIFYVMLALRRHLNQTGWFEAQHIPQPTMSKLLDLVALGTVADVVPLDHNNRILVHQGLRRIRGGVAVPGITALLEVAGRDFARANASDLGFAVGARLNAAGRLEDMSLGIECLLSDDAVEARAKAQVLDQLNDERRHIEKGMQAQALQTLEALNQRLSGELPKGLCLYDEAWHQGVIGILASRVKDKYHRPVIIFAKGHEGEVKGSARSIPGFHVRDALAHIDAKYPNLIKKFGGHAMAAGLTLASDDFKKFQKIFDATVAEKLTEDQLKHSLMTDGALLPEDYNLEVAAMLRDAGPWGQAFPEPLFDDVFELIEQRLVGDRHLKCKLRKAGQVIEAIAFFVDVEQWPNHRCERVRAVYRMDINEYKGRSTVQLIIDYLEAC